MVIMNRGKKVFFLWFQFFSFHFTPLFFFCIYFVTEIISKWKHWCNICNAYSKMMMTTVNGDAYIKTRTQKSQKKKKKINTTKNEWNQIQNDAFFIQRNSYWFSSHFSMFIILYMLNCKIQSLLFPVHFGSTN